MTEIKKPSKIAAILALISLIPVLLVFGFLVMCFAGTSRCPGLVMYYVPLTLLLTWIEWPWGNIVPGGLFTGTLWGRVFILSSIALNVGLIFLGAKVCGWLFSPRRMRSRAWARHMRSIVSSRYRRWLESRTKAATILALIYLIPALVLWLDWQGCSGWNWLCEAPDLWSFAGPWAKWISWSVLTGSNASLEGSLGHLGARIFVLGALWLNAGIIFSLVRVYLWMFGGFRNDPPKLLGTMFSGTYALLALFVYVDATRCSGFLCDIGVMLAAAPWSMLTDVHVRGGGMFLVLLMLAANSILLYAAVALLTHVLLKMKRISSG